MRHQPHPAGLQRLRVQDPRPLLRDGIHPAAGDRRQQAPRRHQRRRRKDRPVQARVPVDIRLGDTRSAPLRERLQPGQHPQREYSIIIVRL